MDTALIFGVHAPRVGPTASLIDTCTKVYCILHGTVSCRTAPVVLHGAMIVNNNTNITLEKSYLAQELSSTPAPLSSSSESLPMSVPLKFFMFTQCDLVTPSHLWTLGRM